MNTKLILILGNISNIKTVKSHVSFIENSMDIQNLPQSLLNNRYVILHNAKLSKNAINVLDSAFGPEYDNNISYANAYNLFNGTKGMDWWNFPWDLGSQKPKYMITYKDMKDILEHVVVRKDKNIKHFVRYSEKLKEIVNLLNKTIIEGHGSGYLRTIKIIYCIRNFLATAIKYNMTNDMQNLKLAAIHLIDMNKNGELFEDPNPNDPHYGIKTFAPRDINGQLENRTRNNGLKDLSDLIKQI